MFRFILTVTVSLISADGGTAKQTEQSPEVALKNAVLHYGHSQSEGFSSHYNTPQSADQLKEAGWIRSNQGRNCPGYNKHSCHKNLGYMWENANGDGPSSHRFKIFTNAKGYISGYAWALASEQDVTSSWAGYYFDKCMVHVAIATREGPNSPEQGVQCDEEKASTGDVIGNHIWVNPGAKANDTNAEMEIPLVKPADFEKKWYKGACFDGMGTHYFHDLYTPGHMSWQADVLLPIVPMYDDATGRLNAVFMTLPKRQNGLFPFQADHDYDRMFLQNRLFCMNTCSPNCTMTDTWGMTTGHLWFGDYKEIKPCNREVYRCSKLLKGINCCPQHRDVAENILV